MKKNKLFNYDKFGMSVSTICLIHCLVLPVIVAIAPFVAFLSCFENPIVEYILRLLAVVNAGFSVMIGFKAHKNYFVSAMFLGAILIFTISFLAHDFIHKHTWIGLIGSVLAFFAHNYNRKLCMSCEKCKIDE
jgi:hypothetical protein